MTSNPWEHFGTGAVVRWNGSLWIVAEASKNRCDLRSVDHNNVSAGPSTSWPYMKAYEDDDGPADHSPDPARTVNTIQLVAPSVRAFVEQRALAVFWENK